MDRHNAQEKRRNSRTAKTENEDGAHSAVPKWLGELFETARAWSDFEKRCELAWKLALNINRLREANEQRASERLSLRHRLESLAKLAKVQIEPVLRWFGVKELSLKASAESLARLSRGLGFNRKDFLEYIRVGEAEARGKTIALAKRGAHGGARFDSATEERFRALKEALDAEYSRSED